MTVERIDPVTGEVIELTEAEARRLTERIRTALDRVSTAWADLAERITEAYQRRADLALGYSSWSEYADAELKPSEGLAADVRRQLVGMLSAQGMSNRAIASSVGVDERSVRRDQVRHIAAPAPEPESLDAYRHRVLADAESNQRIVKLTGAESVADPTPAKITGLDGKTYTRPEKPSETAARVAANAPEKRDTRRPLPDSFWETAYDLNKKAEALLRLTTDDRFNRNRDAIAAKNLHALQQTASTLAQVLAAVNH